MSDNTEDGGFIPLNYQIYDNYSCLASFKCKGNVLLSRNLNRENFELYSCKYFSFFPVAFKSGESNSYFDHWAALALGFNNDRALCFAHSMENLPVEVSCCQYPLFEMILFIEENPTLHGIQVSFHHSTKPFRKVAHAKIKSKKDIYISCIEKDFSFFTVYTYCALKMDLLLASGDKERFHSDTKVWKRFHLGLIDNWAVFSTFLTKQSMIDHFTSLFEKKLSISSCLARYYVLVLASFSLK